KCKKLGKTLSNLNAINVRTRAFDSTKLLELFPESSFDRILLDPPCSGLGQRPSLLSYIEEHSLSDKDDSEIIDYFQEHSRYQNRLMQVAIGLLKKGGILLYSTCTLSIAENEQVIKEAINSGLVE